jgi:hypothetical protein
MGIDTQDLRFSAIEARLSRVEGIIEQMNERIGLIERRLTITMWVTVLIAIFIRRG